MIKRISLLITAALLVATMAMAGLAGPALASPGEDACNAQNDADTTATWGKDPAGGGWTCTTVTKEDVSPAKGNPDNEQRAKPFEQTTTTDETTSGAGGGGGLQTNPKHKESSDSTLKNRGGHEK